jgi:hypothetical protein
VISKLSALKKVLSAQTKYRLIFIQKKRQPFALFLHSGAFYDKKQIILIKQL